MTLGTRPLTQRYRRLVEEIESRFAVAGWRSGDVDLWPPTRMDLFLDMFRQVAGDTAPPAPPFALRAAASLATPLTNAWRSRRDLAHWEPWPKRADAVLLGDGVSLDYIDGAWNDRHGEPVIAALQRQGRASFLMQPGNLARLPWRRPTFAANVIANRGALAAALNRSRSFELADHDAVLRFLEHTGVRSPAPSRARLARRAASIAGAAAAFQRVLKRVQPRLAFMVTYYAGLGHAFALACRREGVLSIDLQHCPQEGPHRAYGWSQLPAQGCSTLPAVFWTWTEADAARIADWASAPWHQALHGGHSQLTPFLDDHSDEARRWDERYAAIGDPNAFDREILVALQPIGGCRTTWEALADRIEASPRAWRWWIRRHPSSSRTQDGEYRRLLQLRGPNVLIEEAGELPLPALLRHMSAMISLASGSAAEAAAFGVPALFLDEEARETFAGLIARGQAEMAEVADVLRRIEVLPAVPVRPEATPTPTIEETLQRLDRMADDYRQMCRQGV